MNQLIEIINLKQDNTTLSAMQKREIEKRGFYVKKLISFGTLFVTIPAFVLTPLVSGAIMLVPGMIVYLIIDLIIPGIAKRILGQICIALYLLLPYIFILLKTLRDFIFYSKEFFYIDGDNIKNIHGGKHEYTVAAYQISSILLLPFYAIFKFISNIFSSKRSTRERSNTIGWTSILYGIFILVFCLIVSIPTLYIMFMPILSLPLEAIYVIGGFLMIYTFTFLFRGLIEIFHPLYAFGNLGEKIQSLTPQIEEKSKQIQSEFQSDMNFSVLSNGFDSLSSTFSSIVTLVIKLEKTETRANKGNLFDSEKYINSLRSDIVTPLTSLRVFLEKKKMELMKSEKELTRVRVGGSEGSENIELQSKRSESLIQELTENIEKLDVMIGKMG